MKITSNYFLVLIVLIGLTSCSSKDDSSGNGDYFPKLIDVDLEGKLFTLQFDYNSSNQIKQVLYQIESGGVIIDDFVLTLTYEGDLISSVTRTDNKGAEPIITFNFEHDNYGVISHVQIINNGGVDQEIDTEYDTQTKQLSLDYTGYPITYYLDNYNYIYYGKGLNHTYISQTDENKKGIFHALPPQTELHMFFELNLFDIHIPYYFSPYTINKILRQPSPPQENIEYLNYEYDEYGNPIVFDYLTTTTSGTYQVSYERR